MARENPVWRSLLYVPANVERFVSKAHTRGADGIILDLEDSVPPGEKGSARASIEKAAALVGQDGADVLVRINRPLDMAVRDIEAVVSPNVRALLLPKLEGPDHVRLLAELVDDVEARKGMEPGHTLFGAMVESASAFFQMEHIAKAHPRVAALMIGGEDFSLSVGMEPATDTLLYPKHLSVIAARAAGVIPLGLMGTVADYQDLDEARKDAELSRRFGMEGGSCIHPSIVPVLNEAFTPTANDVASAQRIVDAYRTATAEGRGSIEIDGHMIDVPVVLRAERLLERDAAIHRRLG
jgi:citrate lyase subunit beta/citryl-CoA lyase